MSETVTKRNGDNTIAIIDYGAGNLGSVRKALDYLDISYRLAGSGSELGDPSGVILPGVGAFGAAAEKLKAGGFFNVLRNYISKDRPFLGICLGMQLLMESSEETPGAEGLGIIKGTCSRFTSGKIPHMGWNNVEIKSNGGYFGGYFSQIPDNSFFYFVHGYYLSPTPDLQTLIPIGPGSNPPKPITYITRYTAPFIAALEIGNLLGVQFHPEKSSKDGLQLLSNWVDRCKGKKNQSEVTP